MMRSKPGRLPLLRLSVILSALGIVAANAYPLAGVLWLEWNPLVVLVLFWLETLAIVIFNVPKIERACGPRESKAPAFTYGGREPAPGSEVSTFLYITTLFMAGHAFALIALFVARGSPILELPDVPPDSMVALIESRWELLLGFLAFFLSELICHFQVFLGEGVYLHVSPRKQMDAPMGRIMGMQIVVVLGGVAGVFLGGIRPTLAVAIAAKILIELVALSARSAAGPRGATLARVGAEG